MIKDLADNLMTEGKQHVRVEIENQRLSRHADFIKDRLRYKTSGAAGRRPSSTSSTTRRRAALPPAMGRAAATPCDGAASRRPATSRDGLRWYAIVRDRAATPRISRDIPRYSAIFRDIPRYAAMVRCAAMNGFSDTLR